MVGTRLGQVTYKAGHCEVQLQWQPNAEHEASIRIVKRDVVIPRGDRKKRLLVFQPKDEAPCKKVRLDDRHAQQSTSLSAGRSPPAPPPQVSGNSRRKRAGKPNRAAAQRRREEEERFIAHKREEWARRLTPDPNKRPASEIRARLLAKVRSAAAS